MTDAERNAERLKERISGRLAEIEEERAALTAELHQVDSFLAALRAYSTLNPDTYGAPALSSSLKARPRNPPREQVLEVVAAALDREGRPMQLRELYAAVTAAGVDLHGSDPSAVLGTMVWRAKGRFTNIKGYGYWPANRAYEPAGYRPKD